MSHTHRARVGVGVIGCGYWGPNLIRNFARHDGARVVAVCDSQRDRAGRMASWYGVPAVTTRPSDLIESKNVELVVVATPSRTHHALAKQAILAGKHVLVMKPMTTQVDQAEELVELAARQGVMLAVDHTFVYGGAVRMMRDLVASGKLGDIYYIDSVRINLGIFQSDVNVIWDLAAHDLSILDYILGGTSPTHVTAVSAAHAGSWAENIAYLTMRYPPDVLAHVHVNWLAPAKIRHTIIGGSRLMVVYDDIHPSEKLRIYDRGVSIAPWSNPEDVYSALVSYRSGDMSAPNLDGREALAVEVDHLLDCIATGATPLADGNSGLRTVRVLEAANIASGSRQPSRTSWNGNAETSAPLPQPVDIAAG